MKILVKIFAGVMWICLILFILGFFVGVGVGMKEAPQVTVVIVQIGSLVAVFFAVLRIERTKEKWVNKYHRGFYRLWMVFSFLPVIALINIFLSTGSYSYPPSDPVEAWFTALSPAIVYIIVLAIGHGVFLVAWWIIRGFR